MFTARTTSDTKRGTYSMRQQHIFDFLEAHHTGVLSSITPNGDPHGAVVCYAIDTDFSVWFITKVGTRKYDNLMHNGRVMLTVFDNATQTTAQVTGIAVEYAGMRDIRRTADTIFAKLCKTDMGIPPIMKLQAGAFTTFQIEPVQIRLASYADVRSGSYSDIFDSIESFELKDS